MKSLSTLLTLCVVLINTVTTLGYKTCSYQATKSPLINKNIYLTNPISNYLGMTLLDWPIESSSGLMRNLLNEDKLWKKEFSLDSNFPRFDTDIKVSDTSYELYFDLPGVQKDEINIILKDNLLTITAKKKGEPLKEGEKFQHKERFEGEISRSFYIPDDANQEDPSASYTDGVLKMVFTKSIDKNSQKVIKVV